MLHYTVDLYNNKVQEDSASIVLEQKAVHLFIKNIIETLKTNIKIESDKSKNTLPFIGIGNFFDRFITSLHKHAGDFIKNEKMNKTLQNLLTILEKVAEKYDLKNLTQKITDAKTKINDS